MKRLFISQPMRDKTDEEILAEREKAVKVAKEMLGVYLTKKPKNQSKKTVFPPVKLQELYRLWYNQKKQPSLPEIKILQEKIVVQNKPEK